MSTSGFGPLLHTKIVAPLPPTQLVAHTQLQSRLREGPRRTLTLISAPAGFGKTSLVSAWAHETDNRGRVAWLSLDEDDRDPIQFFYYLVAALQVVEPGVGKAPIMLLGRLQAPTPKDLIALLLNELSESDDELTQAR